MEGLIPSWIATRGDLNAAEQENMLDGLAKRKWQRIGVDRLLDDLAARQLHRTCSVRSRRGPARAGSVS